MKITATEILDKGSFLGHAFLAAMGAASDADQRRISDVFAASGHEGLEITFDVAGVRINAHEFFSRFQSEMESLISRAAHDLVASRLGEAMTEMLQLHDDLERRSRELFNVTCDDL